MNVSAVNNLGFRACVPIPKQSHALNRQFLTKTNSTLKNLAGPDEVRKAKAYVALNVAENAAIASAMAQMPGFDEAALAANEIKMAIGIFNNIYNFDLSKIVIKSILAGCAGNRVGTFLFKGASKLVTWVPFIGNGLNATVASGTTAALGAALISIAEDMDKARRRGEKMDKIIREIEGK